jgi:hypothetical protein
MNKKYLGIATIIIVVLAVLVAWVSAQQPRQSDSAKDTKNSGQPAQVTLKFSDVIASYPLDPKPCHHVAVNPDVVVDEKEKMMLEMSVMTSIIDIPAGTNVDVFYKSYGKDEAKGTAIYESTYGSYNFTSVKTKNGWITTDFVACKK